MSFRAIVDVKKIAASTTVRKAHLPDLRASARMSCEMEFVKLVGRVPADIRWQEYDAPLYLPPTLNWWQRIMERFGRTYPDEVMMMTRIVGFAYGYYHPSTGIWTDADPNGPKTITFLP